MPKRQVLTALYFFEPVEANPPPIELLLEDGDEVGCIGEWMGAGIQSLLELFSDSLVSVALGCVEKRNVVFGMVLLAHQSTMEINAISIRIASDY